jgi:hypothetical protein
MVADLSGSGPKAKKMKKVRKPYEKPIATKLTPQEAKLKLLHRARMGDRGARELLEMLFPEEAINNRKSA